MASPPAKQSHKEMENHCAMEDTEQTDATAFSQPLDRGKRAAAASPAGSPIKSSALKKQNWADIAHADTGDCSLTPYQPSQH